MALGLKGSTLTVRNVVRDCFDLLTEEFIKANSLRTRSRVEGRFGGQMDVNTLELGKII
jgi:hypothetical protein